MPNIDMDVLSRAIEELIEVKLLESAQEGNPFIISADWGEHEAETSEDDTLPLIVLDRSEDDPFKLLSDDLEATVSP